MNTIKFSAFFVHSKFGHGRFANNKFSKIGKITKKAVAALLFFSLTVSPLAGCGSPNARGISPAKESAEYTPVVSGETPVSPSGASASENLSRQTSTSADIVSPPVVTAESPEEFYAATIPAFLGNADGQNRIYSPANVYIALSMLAEITDGESREQLLSLLGAEDVESLRDYVSKLWSGNCRDDEVSTILPAASLWTDKSLSLQKDTVKTLSESYHAATYQGKMGSDDFNREFQQWLNDGTGGLLEQQVSGQGFTEDTLMALASTLYFKNRWTEEFSGSKTVEETFHAKAEDIPCDFMHQSRPMNFYWGEHFTAVALDFMDGSSMWLLLPDEDFSVETLLQKESKLTELVIHPSDWEDTQYSTVNLSVPKFDVSSDLELSDLLRELGVTDIFSAETADFSAIMDPDVDAPISEITHAARVIIDEKGCEAAAFTTIMRLQAAKSPSEEVDFVADRPFVFVITGAGDLPLFTGVVNRPV